MCEMWQGVVWNDAVFCVAPLRRAIISGMPEPVGVRTLTLLYSKQNYTTKILQHSNTKIIPSRESYKSEKKKIRYDNLLRADKSRNIQTGLTLGCSTGRHINVSQGSTYISGECFDKISQ